MDLKALEGKTIAEITTIEEIGMVKGIVIITTEKEKFVLSVLGDREGDSEIYLEMG